MILVLGLIGILVGLISGLTGLGGGIIIIPALLSWFKYQALFSAQAMQMAANTSLAILIFSNASNSYHYHRSELVDWPLVKSFSPGLLIGIIIGSILANTLDTHALEKTFGLFLLVIGLNLLIPRKNPSNQHKSTLFIIYLISLCTGCLAPMFGIGGGILMIPFFHAQGLNLLKAIGSSVICLLPIAIFTLGCNTIMGLINGNLPPISMNTLGFIYWPGLLIIAPMSMIIAPHAVNLAKKINTAIIKKMLAMIIVITAIKLIIA